MVVLSPYHYDNQPSFVLFLLSGLCSQLKYSVPKLGGPICGRNLVFHRFIYIYIYKLSVYWRKDRVAQAISENGVVPHCDSNWVVRRASRCLNRNFILLRWATYVLYRPLLLSVKVSIVTSNSQGMHVSAVGQFSSSALKAGGHRFRLLGP